MAKNKSRSKIDLATIGGLILAFAGILGGLVLEGGKMSDVQQMTAGMIVMGGTLGAVMVTTPMRVLIRAAKKLGAAFFEEVLDAPAVIDEIVQYATKARKNSIVSLESDLPAIRDPFLKKAISLAVDGTDLQDLKKMMELQIILDEKHAEAEAKVYEAAGGYSPTIGIIGAVLGLIQVMKHLENIEEVGKGIAVAFVATVYGVAVSNLFFLPVANKLKARVAASVHMRELMLEGVISIVEGMNPKLIRTKLEAYVEEGSGKPSKASQGAQPAGEPAVAKG